MDHILVTGAIGTVGRQVVSQLLATGARVRAPTRNPDAAGLPPEVEVVRGDLTAPATLDGCLEGVDAVFLVRTARGCRPGGSRGPDGQARPARRVPLLPHRTAH